MSNPFAWIASLIGMNLLWSTSYAFVKMALGALDPLSLIFWRFSLAFAILAVWIALKGYPLRMHRGDLLRILAAGVLLGVSNWLWVWGIDLSHAADASLLYVFEPVWGILLASIILKERLLWTTIVGLALVLVGLAALSRFDLAAIGLGGGGVGRGNLLIVLGLVCEGFYSITLKPLAQRVPAPVVAAGGLAVALVILALPISLRGSLPLPATPGILLPIVFLAVVCTVVGYTLWIEAMKHVPVGIMLFTIFIQPLLGPCIAWAVLGEALGARIFIGGLLLLSGMLVAVAGHVRSQRRSILAAADDAVGVIGGV